MNYYSTNLETVLAPLLERIQADYSAMTDANQNDASTDGKIVGRLGQGRAGLLQAASRFEPACDRIPEVEAKGNVDPNWINLVLREIQEFNRNGADYINSSSEALIKVHGIMNWWFQFDLQAIYRALKEQDEQSQREKVSFAPKRIPPNKTEIKWALTS